FTRTKENANNVYKYLDRKLSDQVRVIHSNKSQNSRINAFNDFREGKIRVLVTTDVSARGLDINMVSHVINFDVPRAYEEYVHRIGRTGRAEQSGIAISFVNEVEEIHMKEIEKIISDKIEERALPKDVPLIPTDKEELQEIAMEIDKIKRAKNPDFKGAFHEKKKKVKPIKIKIKNKRKKRR
ncbi:MAG: C-terminal helicase domain-containing protein, partial [Cyclobacteriaceae bacterium]|nr:C-terminal helicase domain-containing protein [Cyclobacteriaceae bacterium]